MQLLNYNYFNYYYYMWGCKNCIRIVIQELRLLLFFFGLVDETTTDIICIKCKKDNSDSPNEIVLCDMCGIGEYICPHS